VKADERRVMATAEVHDDTTCTCPEHRPLSALALVLHEQEIGCRWHKVSERNRTRYESMEFGTVAVVYTAGPFLHDGWHHDGDHKLVALTIVSLAR